MIDQRIARPIHEIGNPKNGTEECETKVPTNREGLSRTLVAAFCE